jgi:hypothetical protein
MHFTIHIPIHNNHNNKASVLWNTLIGLRTCILVMNPASGSQQPWLLLHHICVWGIAIIFAVVPIPLDVYANSDVG